MNDITLKWGCACHQNCTRQSVQVHRLVMALILLVVLLLATFICIMTKFITVVTLNFLFIKLVTTWMTWVLIMLSTNDICKFLLRHPLEKFLPLPLQLFLSLPIPRIMDDCARNAPSNDVFDLLILC